jgi:ketosteroid isomerase-like protein
VDGSAAASAAGLESYEFEVIAAGTSGDLADTGGYERNRVKVEGVPTTYTLRVTNVYRRENGEWRIVHRHGDRPPDRVAAFEAHDAANQSAEGILPASDPVTSASYTETIPWGTP